VADVVQGLIDAVELATKRGDAKAQISAWREIAKILGFYPQTKSVGKTKIDPSDLKTWPTDLLAD
jgi:hypothetical protein